MFDHGRYIKKDKEDIREEQENSSPVEISALLSHKQFNDLQNGYAELIVPYGVKMSNKLGKRRLSFVCENKKISKELIEGLENSGICWQEIWRHMT